MEICWVRRECLACSMLRPGESRPRRRMVEVVMMLVLAEAARAAAAALPSLAAHLWASGHL